MARTTSDDTFNPQILTDTVQGFMTGKNALKNSMLIASGAAIAEPSFTGGRGKLGKLVEVPYFGTIGEFEENIADGDAATPRKIGSLSESSFVTRDTLAIETTTWARTSASEDPHTEAARLIVEAAGKNADKRCVTAAVATGAIINATGANINFDATIDSKYKFNDEQEDVVAMMVHSQVMADLLKLKDTQNRPLLIDSIQVDGSQSCAGMLGGTSDRVDISGSTQGAVSDGGTAPPTVTLAGTPLGAYTLKIEIVAGGAVGAATFRFSTDGGSTWSETHVTAASVLLDESPTATALTPADDSMVGRNGATGITASFAAGTYNADNFYDSKTNLIASCLILKRNSIAWWFNRAEMAMQTDKDILRDSQLAAMHVYGTALRYRRRPGSSQTGVVNMTVTQSEFDGTL